MTKSLNAIGRNLAALFFLTTGSLIVTGCTTEPTSVHVKQTAATAANWRPGAVLTHDEILSLISDRIPGFGGLHQSSNGITVFLLNPGRDSAMTEPVMRAVLRSAASSGRYELSSLANSPIQFVQGEFGFRQLTDWKRSFYKRRVPTGTVFVEIDKFENRLRVTTSRMNAQSDWSAIAAAEGVPNGAVLFSTADAPHPDVDLQSVVRPTAGGVQLVMYNNGSSQGVCSLGANAALWSNSGGKYFVTASHCSHNMWSTDTGTQEWHQTGGNQIGAGEAADPSPWPNGTLDQFGNPMFCYSGMLCRFSDATLVPYTDGSAWQLGRLAIAGTTSPFVISQFQQFGAPPCYYCPSTTQYRTGRSSGTRTGSYNRYNADFFPDSATYASVGVTIRSNWVMLNQTYVPNMYATGGDSGGPMFHYEQSDTYNTNPIFDGIYHAGNSSHRIYSPVGNLAELGANLWDIYFY